MSWLLWREYRANGAILIAGAALMFLPYLINTMMWLWPTNLSDHPAEVAQSFTAAVVMSYSLSQLTVAFLGGNSFAGERADRSAEFMAYLPVSKNRRVVSKLIFASIVTAIIWGISLLVLWGLSSLPWRIDPEGAGFDPENVALTGFIMFAVGWFVSSLQSSPTFAVCAAIAVPLLTLISLLIFAEKLRLTSGEFEDFVGFWYTAISVSLGIASLLLGTWYYLTRIEP